MKEKKMIRVAVGAIVFNKEGKVLIGRRGKSSRDEVGKWDFPGGAVDFGETFEEAIKREAKEEFGINIKLIEFFRPVQVIEPGKHWVGAFFIAKLASGEAKLLEKDKFSDLKWVSLEEIDKNELTVPGKQNFKAYIDKCGEKKRSI